MANFKVTHVESLPQIPSIGTLYFLNTGELFLGKENEFLQIAKDESDVKFISELPTENIQQEKLYALFNDGKLTLHIHDGNDFVELSKQVEISDVTGLEDLLSGLITTLNNKAESALLTVLSNRIDNHELGKINTESGLHSIRLWEGKLQEWDEENSVWKDVIGNVDLSTIEDELNALIQEKLEGLETAPLEHTHEISHVTDLQTKLDEKVNQVDLDTTLENYYENTAQNIIALFEAIDEHEKSLIVSENGCHGVRVFDGKFEQYDEASATWIEILSTGAPSEHNHTTDDILGLSEFVNNMIAGLATGEIELSDASLIAKGIVQLSNEIDSEDETKAITPKALKTSIDNIKTVYNQAIEDLLNDTKTYTDNIATITLNDAILHSDTNDTLTLDSAKTYADIQDNVNLGLSKDYTDIEIVKVKTESDGKYANKVHTHPISDIVNLQNSLDNKSPLNHKHEIADVNDLQTTLDAKANLSNFNTLKQAFDTHKHEITDVNGLEDKLGTFITSNHTHAWTQITNRPTSTANAIDTAVSNSHAHINKNVLDNLEDGNGILIYNGNPLGETAYLSVQTIAERDAIPMEARKEGLMVLVLDDGGMYYLKNGTDNAFWEIFATGAGGATNASTLPATPSGDLTGLNTQALIDELEMKKANLSDVYTKGEVENVINNKSVDYYTLDNLPDLSGLHSHGNKETLDLFNQFQGNLTWKGKTLGDLVTEIYDVNKDGIIDKASTLNGMTVTVEDLNKLSGIADNVQAQLNSISSGSIFRGEYSTYADMVANLPNPQKGDWVFVLNDETKNGAINTQYLHDGNDFVYGGGSTKVSDATLTTKGIIQLGGDLAGVGSTSTSPKLTPTGVASGTYKSANITVGDDGRIVNAEEGNIVFLNDTITSPDEGWSSEKISSELSKYALRNHTHAQLHNANMLGKVELNEDVMPSNTFVPTYNSITGKAEWKQQQGGKVYVGSKSIEGSYTLKAGSYITLMINEVTKEITINSTFRDGGGSTLIPSGIEIVHSIDVKAGEKLRFSVESGYNKVMLHTLQMVNTRNVTAEVRLYNQSADENGLGGFIEYNSNPEMFISDIINIPIFDFDNDKMLHFEVENLGVEDSTFTIRAKCTNLL